MRQIVVPPARSCNPRELRGDVPNSFSRRLRRGLPPLSEHLHPAVRRAILG